MSVKTIAAITVASVAAFYVGLVVLHLFGEPTPLLSGHG